MLRRTLLSILLVGTLGLPGVRAETLVSSDIGSNIFVYLKVNPEAAQALLPEGWELKPWSKGAWAGANVMLLFRESLHQRGEDGKRVRDGVYHGLTVFTWGRTEDVKWRIFAPLDYGTDMLGINPGRDRTLAGVSRVSGRAASGGGFPTGTEAWRVAADGGVLDFAMSFGMRRPGHSTPKGRVADPDDPEGPGLAFRIQQLSYMVLGLNGVDTVDEVTLTNTVPGLSALFDGTQEILAIRLLPVKLTERYRDQPR